MPRLVSILFALSIFIQLPAFSADAPSEPDTIKVLSALAMNLGTEQPGNLTAPEAFRGGPKSSQPLGFYRDKNKVEFRSPYAKESASVIARFAYDLHQYIVSKGGGYDNYLKQEVLLRSAAPTGNIQNRPVDAKAMELLAQEMAQRDALPKTHIGYALQIDFAKAWWEKNSPEFKKTNGLMQEWWLNDSVLDANNLWAIFSGPYSSDDKGKANWLIYEMDAIANKH